MFYFCLCVFFLSFTFFCFPVRGRELFLESTELILWSHSIILKKRKKIVGEWLRIAYNILSIYYFLFPSYWLFKCVKSVVIMIIAVITQGLWKKGYSQFFFLDKKIKIVHYGFNSDLLIKSTLSSWLTLLCTIILDFNSKKVKKEKKYMPWKTLFSC